MVWNSYFSLIFLQINVPSQKNNLFKKLPDQLNWTEVIAEIHFFYISCVFTYFLKIFQQYESLIHNLNTGSVILMIILTVSVLNHDTFGNVATKELPGISFNWNKYIMKILLIKTAVANLHLWWMIKESIYLMEQDHSMKNLLSTLSKNCHWKTWH